MSPRWAKTTLLSIVVIFVFSLLDASYLAIIPEQVEKIASVILSGVAIGLILYGLNQNGKE